MYYYHPLETPGDHYGHDIGQDAIAGYISEYISKISGRGKVLFLK